MMKPAVRAVNAFPRVLKRAAVPAFEIAASFAGTTVPSNPTETNPVIGSGVFEGPGPPPRNCVVAGAPVILKTPEHVSFSVSHRDGDGTIQRGRGRNGLRDDGLHLGSR